MNAKQLLQSLGLLIQLTPSELWGGAIHSSGLFAELLKTLLAEEVRQVATFYILRMELKYQY